MKFLYLFLLRNSYCSVRHLTNCDKYLKTRKFQTFAIFSQKKGPDPETREDFEKAENPESKGRHEYYKERARNMIDMSLVPKGFFENMDRNKESFITAVKVFHMKDKHARGHVEFIKSAMKFMKHFGVHKDLESYRALMDVFPKGRMISRSMFQVEFMHYPKQQNCAIELLDQMEWNGIMPDTEMHELVVNIFGTKSFPSRKCFRMIYWMPKFKNLSPWPVPDPLPELPIEIAKIAINRMTSVDLQTKISIYDAKELEDANDHTWIVSGQSPEQRKLIETHPSDRPIYVEGAFRLWLARTCINYFVIRADPRDPPKVITDDELNDVGGLKNILDEDYEEKNIFKKPTVHEQEDGVILAICATGTSSRDSLVSWIRFLERTNPRLGKDVSVLFTLKSPLGPTEELEALDESEIDKQKEIGRGQYSFGYNPRNPSLSQVGIWETSDARYVNWPHDHNPKSLKIREEEMLKLQEKIRQKEHEKISKNDYQKLVNKNNVK